MRALWDRFRTWIVVALAGTATAGAGMMALSQGGGGIDVFVGSTPTPVATSAPATTANIWVQQGGGTCTGGRSSTLITFAAASSPDRICGTFDAACQAMNAGDLALIKGSTSFTAQTLSSSCNGTSGNVKRLCVAGGESVVITDEQAVLWSNSDYVEVCGNANGWGTNTSVYGQFRWEATAINNATGYQFNPGTTGSGIDGVEGDANGWGGDADTTSPCDPDPSLTKAVCTLNLVYSAGSTTGIYVKNSDLCCNNDKLIFPDNDGNPVDQLLVQGNYLHDQVKLTVSGGAHYECYYGNGTTNSVIRGNVFNVCRATGAINHTCLGGCQSGAEPSNVLIENNLILSTPEATTDNEHVPGVDGCAQCVGYVRYRNNYIRNGLALYDNGVNEVTGNVLPTAATCSRATHSNNIFASGTCAGTDQAVSNIFTNDAYYSAGSGRVASFNYCPSGTSPTLGAGNDSIFPSTDILGRARSTNIDAGPYQGTC